jgi:hypothetical protein
VAGPLSKEAGMPRWGPGGVVPRRPNLDVSLGTGGKGGLDVFQLWIRWPGPGMAAVLFCRRGCFARTQHRFTTEAYDEFMRDKQIECDELRKSDHSNKMATMPTTTVIGMEI